MATTNGNDQALAPESVDCRSSPGRSALSPGLGPGQREAGDSEFTDTPWCQIIPRSGGLPVPSLDGFADHFLYGYYYQSSVDTLSGPPGSLISPQGAGELQG